MQKCEIKSPSKLSTNCQKLYLLTLFTQCIVKSVISNTNRPTGKFCGSQEVLRLNLTFSSSICYIPAKSDNRLPEFPSSFYRWLLSHQYGSVLMKVFRDFNFNLQNFLQISQPSRWLNNDEKFYRWLLAIEEVRLLQFRSCLKGLQESFQF